MQHHPASGKVSQSLAVYAAGLSLLFAFVCSLAGVGLSPNAQPSLPELAKVNQIDLATIPRIESLARPAAERAPELHKSRPFPAVLAPSIFELPSLALGGAGSRVDEVGRSQPRLAAYQPRAPPPACA